MKSVIETKSHLLLFLRVFFFFLLLGLLSRLGIGLFSSFQLQVPKDLPVFLWGLHFDLAAAGFFSILWVVFYVSFMERMSWQKIWVGFLGFTYLFVAASDYVYILESGRHLGYEVRNFSSIHNSLGNLLVKYSPYIFLSFVATLLLFWFFRFHKIENIKNQRRLSSSVGARILTAVFVFVPSFICVRGFQGIPLDPSYSYRAGSVREASLSLNPVYSIVYSGLSGYQAIPEKIEVPFNLKTEQVFLEWRKTRGIDVPRYHSKNNLILVFLEGWPEHRETPHFLKMKKEEALSVSRMLALGQRTVEGIFASLCSWPNPLGRGIMFSQLENFHYDCLPQKFVERGYHTAFFQGSDQLTSGVGPLAQKLGFQKSFGKMELSGALKKEQNFWGLFDRDLYQYILDYINEIPEPFFIGLNTNTTHDLKLPQGVLPKFGFENQTEQHQSVMWYADQELHQFVLELKKLRTKNPVTLVFVADHTSYYSGGYLDQYSIPFALVGPDVPIGLKNKMSSQIDVAATLADLFGISAPHYLGQSLLRGQSQNGILLFHLGSAVWIEENLAVVFNSRVPNQWSCYQVDVDPNLTTKVPCPENSQEVYQRGVSYVFETQRHIYQGTTSQSYR